MQIIPNMPYAASSQAEGEVFYKLQNCFNSKEAKDNIIAYHSINLSSLAKDCFKEADFVVLSRYGLFVLEVKGGGVFIKNDEYNGTLGEFLESVTLVADVDEYDEEQDTAVLMTIHSSKGLEFTEVFLAGMEEGIFPGMRSIEGGQEEIEEEKT